MLLWICGVSGCGKTTLGQAIYARLKPRVPALFLLDGDDFRSAMGGELGYTPEERAKNALRIARLCHLLDGQGIHVICCAVTLPPQVQRINRERCEKYLEIYIEVNKATLLRRDPKGLYHRCLSGEVKDLPGFDVKYVPPQHPDLVIPNDVDLATRDAQVASVLDLVDDAIALRQPPRAKARS